MGMDPGMEMGSSSLSSNNSTSTNVTTSMLMSMMMAMTQFHASSGDTLWIEPFVPSTAAAVFGASVLLFFVGILSRFLDAVQRSFTVVWASKMLLNNDTSLQPWKVAHEVPRGALFLVHSGVQYLLMLSVMTYNAYYFVAVLLGLGIGEATFGRFGRYQQEGCRSSSFSPLKSSKKTEL